MDGNEGYLEVGCNEQDEIVVNHPDLKPDENGVGHIVFSADQARNLAELLLKHAAECDHAKRKKSEDARRAAAKTIPVDRSARVLTDGSEVTDDHREINPLTGQQKGYVVLSAEERAKGFVKPVRRTYRHSACGSTTTMGIVLLRMFKPFPAGPIAPPPEGPGGGSGPSGG